MEEIRPNSILKFNPNQLAEVRKEFNYEDVNKLIQDIDVLDEWIKKQNHFLVRDFDREYLERYIISNKGSVERTKKRLDKLFTLRNLMPEFMRNFDIRNEFIPMFKCMCLCVLPKPTKDNYRVTINTIHSDIIDGMELIDYYRYNMVFVEYLLRHDYNAGYEYVLDTSNMTLGMVSKLNPILVHKALTLLVWKKSNRYLDFVLSPTNIEKFLKEAPDSQYVATKEAYGLRLRRLHFISGTKFFDTVLSIFKQGMTQKLRERIKIHSTRESLTDYIPKEMLPKDFGGNEKTVKEISEQNYKELCSDEHVARMKFIEGVTTDESCRLSCAFNEEYSGMPGSFKTLCVD